MVGEIKAGMKFGNYKGTINLFEKSCTRTSQSQRYYCEASKREYTQRSDTYRDLLKNNIRAVAEYTEEPDFYKGKSVDRVSRYLKMGSYLFGSTNLKNEEINNYDYIKSYKSNQHAVDLNGNGLVDNDEIFSGELDTDAYDKAKQEDGTLKNYSQYRYNNAREAEKVDKNWIM